MRITLARMLDINEIITQDEIPIILLPDSGTYRDPNKNLLCEIIDGRKEADPICIDISFREAPSPNGEIYVSVNQNTDKWHDARKLKITGSRISYLLGLHGKGKFNDYWEIVKFGKEDKNKLDHIENTKRGRLYENDALKHFEKVSKCQAKQCGFFEHPSKKRYGASPDALASEGMLLEIKTRGVKSF